jgi:hypothetical protein
MTQSGIVETVRSAGFQTLKNEVTNGGENTGYSTFEGCNDNTHAGIQGEVWRVFLLWQVYRKPGIDYKEMSFSSSFYRILFWRNDKVYRIR